MIKEKTYYDIICDRCGKSLADESETCYLDTESAEMAAKDSEWMTIDGKHYCADCYVLDQNTDEYVSEKGDKKMSRTIYCGECEKFLYEDINGYGVCDKTNEDCCCCDKCHITHGKP